MKQAYMPKAGVIEYREVPEPTPTGKEVLLKVSKIGICGSDLHVFEGKHPLVSFPLVQGHEFSGYVVETGPDATKVKEGDLAVVQPAIGCGHCERCREGVFAQCDDLQFIGGALPGGGSEYFLVSEDHLVKMGKGVSPEDAAMIEPLAVAVHTAAKVPGIQGKSLLVIGAGTIGNLTAQVAADLGIEITSNIGPPKDKDIASKDPDVPKAGIEFLTGIMKAMARLDSRVLAGVLYTYWPSEFDDLDKPAIWAWGVESVKTLGKIAEDLNIDYCLEVVNRFETNILNTSEEGVRFCRDVDCPSVKLLLDTFHMNIEEDNIADALRYGGAYLGHLHVGEGNRKPPGQGSLPWEEIGQALRDIGYDRGVVMEPFVIMGGKVGEDIKVWRDLSGGAGTEKMDRDIRESLRFLKKHFWDKGMNDV